MKTVSSSLDEGTVLPKYPPLSSSFISGMMDWDDVFFFFFLAKGKAADIEFISSKPAQFPLLHQISSGSLSSPRNTDGLITTFPLTAQEKKKRKENRPERPTPSEHTAPAELPSAGNNECSKNNSRYNVIKKLSLQQVDDVSIFLKNERRVLRPSKIYLEGSYGG